MKTVVLGGYGNFGARICRALAGDPAIALVIAGRNAQRAAAFAAELGENVGHACLDISGATLEQELAALGAGLVIHTAGPFQQQDYAVARAVAAAGAHYIDLADGRRFVCDFAAALDPLFRACGRSAITGASTVPALSSAVIDHLCIGWSRIDAIDICIAPAQTAPRGLATMAAVLSYCGAPVQVWSDGAWQVRHGWAEPQRVRFARLEPRLGALCDIPDLELFPVRYPGVRSVMFRAALELGFTQRALALLAGLKRIGLLTRPQRLAGAFMRMADHLDRFGSALGGMVVRVAGADADGASVTRAWHIAADHDHGPEIPCMPAILLARRFARGELPAIGARPCVGLLALHEFAPEFANWGMVTDVIETGAD